MDTPVKRPAAERRRPTIGDGVLALLVILCAAALFFGLRPASGNLLTARIVLDGVLVAEYDLNALTSPVGLAVDGGAYPMVIQAEPGRIRVLESGCPSQDCVHTGWADRAGDQIICLPNRLVISLSGAEAQTDFDAVTG